MRTLLLASLLFGLIGTAQASDPETRQLIECAPGKNFVKMSEAIGSLEADKLDTINTKPSFTLLPRDTGELPKRVFVRGSDGTEIDLDYSAEGEVVEFLPSFERTVGGELCVEDPIRQGRPKTEDAYAFSMEFNMNFLNTSGTYSMDEIKDGLKDGKTALKKIIGGPGSLLVPSLSHLYVEYADNSTKPQFSARKDGKDLGEVPFTKLGDAYLIAYDVLKKKRVDSLVVGGGAHTLSPSLSPKRMAKIMKPKGDSDGE